MGDTMYGRCLGHGALPFGKAWGLAQAPKAQVQCYADTPGSSSTLMKNGFVLLTITKEGLLTETFYDQDGNVADWVAPFSYQLGPARSAV